MTSISFSTIKEFEKLSDQDFLNTFEKLSSDAVWVRSHPDLTKDCLRTVSRRYLLDPTLQDAIDRIVKSSFENLAPHFDKNIRLAVNDKYVYSNLLVLSCRSDFFKRMLCGGMKDRFQEDASIHEVCIKEINPNALSIFIEFINQNHFEILDSLTLQELQQAIQFADRSLFSMDGFDTLFARRLAVEPALERSEMGAIRDFCQAYKLDNSLNTLKELFFKSITVKEAFKFLEKKLKVDWMSKYELNKSCKTLLLNQLPIWLDGINLRILEKISKKERFEKTEASKNLKRLYDIARKDSFTLVDSTPLRALSHEAIAWVVKNLAGCCPTELNLSFTKIENLNFLEGIEVRKLSLQNCTHLKEIKMPKECSLISDLNIAHCTQISNFEGFYDWRLNSLKKLTISKDISFPEDLKYHLISRNTKICDIAS